MPERVRLLSSGLRWVWVAVVVFALDRLSKWLAVTMLPLDGESVSLLRHVRLTLLFNRGAAFSLWGEAAGWQVCFLSFLAVMASLVILYGLSQLPASRRGLCIALALILGGAIGNLFDRLLYASVIDFIDLYVGHFHWPVFNVADSAICLGALGVITDSFKRGKS